MAVLDILTYPDEQLKQACERVKCFDDALKLFIQNLDETRLMAKGCVGIAAPQVGCFQRIAIVDVSKNRKPVENNGHMVLINPEITHWDGMEVGREGCLSVPDFTGNVIRATQISLQAHDASGKLQQYEFSGFEARAIQHEIDHLDGLLFLDRLVSRHNDLFKRKVYKK